MKILKWIGIIVGGLIVLGIIGSLFSGNDSKQQTQQPTASAPAASTPTKTEPAKQPDLPKNNPSMNKAEFDQLKSGMTYEKCIEIIGGPGEVASESGNPGDQFHTVMYQYEGEGDFGANANLMFQGNKLQSKAQFGLK